MIMKLKCSLSGDLLVLSHLPVSSNRACAVLLCTSFWNQAQRGYKQVSRKQEIMCRREHAAAEDAPPLELPAVLPPGQLCVHELRSSTSQGHGAVVSPRPAVDSTDLAVGVIIR